MPRLRRLDLSSSDPFADALSDRSLLALPASCPLLQEISFPACNRFTLDGVRALIDGCLQLKRVKYCGVFFYKMVLKDLKLGKYRKVIFEEAFDRC